MNKQFLAKFKITRQVGPEDWVYIYTEKLFSEETSLKELKLWMKEELSIKDHIDFRIESLELSEPKQ